MSAPPLSYRTGLTDAQVRNGAGIELSLIVPAQHFLAALAPAGAMTTCPGGYLCPHRIISIIIWNTALVPADGSMNRILFAETVVRLAWLNALFAAIEPEVDVATQQASSLQPMQSLPTLSTSLQIPHSQRYWLRESLQRPICSHWLRCRRSPQGCPQRYGRPGARL